MMMNAALVMPLCFVLDELLRNRAPLQLRFLALDGALLLSTCCARDEKNLHKAVSVILTTVSSQVTQLAQSCMAGTRISA